MPHLGKNDNFYLGDRGKQYAAPETQDIEEREEEEKIDHYGLSDKSFNCQWEDMRNSCFNAIENRQSTEKQISDMNLNDKVLLMGNIANVNELYQAFDLFLMPSLYEENNFIVPLIL